MNRRLTHRRTKIAAIAAVLLITTATAAGSAVADGKGGPGKEREAAALTGTAKLQRPAGDDVTMSFDAHLDAKDRQNPLAAHGTFRFSHYMGDWGGAAEAKVDCLITGGKVAVVSGVVTKADRDLKDAVGKRVGITVHDTGKVDGLGYSWAALGLPQESPDDFPKCVSSAPFEKTKAGTGDLKVLPWKFDRPAN
ncbi:Repetin [Streptomyces sp. ISL-98]|uniref:Repetin n=1 Tax=Streptomyces sp. ISL-98 TaxID=2819192 RepID=UPI001BE4E96C|nr:Repetin [Streptomyces sp. ISL-98]MBT2509075.1 Repetin [Streptomyces sp. ISL-98]